MMRNLLALGIAIFLMTPVAAQDACTTCSCTGTTVDCTGASLTAVPTNIPIATTILILRNNKIPSLAAQSFNTLVNLEVLNLEGNKIQTLVVGTFAGVVNLLELNLASNQLSSLDPNVFDTLTKLEKLYITSNKLTTLDVNVFSGLTTLQLLFLGSNWIETLPDDVFDPLTALTQLTLESNRLSATNHLLTKSLTSLTSLSLGSNQITSVAPAAFTLNTKLTSLLLNNNQITELAASQFSSMTALEILSINFNRLTTLPDTIFPASTSTLQYLSIQDNLIVTVASTIFDNLSNLIALTAGGSNQWNCCGLEWLRDLVTVQDLAQIVCSRPQLAAGEPLGDQVGTIQNCGQDAPETPAAPEVSNPTSTQLTVTWQATHGNAFDVSHYILEVNSSVDATWTTVQCVRGVFPLPNDNSLDVTVSDCSMVTVQDGASVSPLTYTLTGLSPDTMYSFRVQAVNEVASGEFSNPSTATATSESAPAKPDTPSVTTTSTTAVVSWTQPDPPNGVIVKYVVKTSGPTTVADQEVTAPATQTTIMNLAPFSAYNFSVIAHTDAGPGPESDATVKSTQPAAPDAPTLQLQTRSSSTLTLTVVPPTVTNGVITLYTLYFVNSAGGYVFVDNTTTTTFPVPDLSPATTGNYSVSATTVIEGQKSDAQAFTTLSAEPSKPDAPTVTTLSASSLRITWTEPVPSNGDIVKYEVYQENITSAANPTLLATVAGTVSSYDRTGLLAASTYQFAIKAFTQVNGTYFASDLSDYGQQKTSQAAPQAVQSQASVVFSSTLIFLSWEPPTISNGNITGYVVYQIEKSRNLNYYDPILDTTAVKVYEGNDTTFSHGGLDPATTYKYGIVARTAGGQANVTDLIQASTKEDVPSRPGIPSLTVLGPTEVLVEWTAPETPNGNIIQYDIHSSQTPGADPVFSANTMGVLNATISGLDSDTSYVFSVTAYTAIGPSDRSFTKAVRTENDDPDYTEIVIVVVIVAFVVILAIGYAYEKRKRAGTAAVSSEETQQGAQRPPVNAMSRLPPPALPGHGAQQRTALGSQNRRAPVPQRTQAARFLPQQRQPPQQVRRPRSDSTGSESSTSSYEGSAPQAPRPPRQLPPVRTNKVGFAPST